MLFFFFKQKTAYEMRISDWSSDVCSSDLVDVHQDRGHRRIAQQQLEAVRDLRAGRFRAHVHEVGRLAALLLQQVDRGERQAGAIHHDEIGRAHVRTPVTNAHLVCRLLLEKKKQNTKNNNKLLSTRILTKHCNKYK